MSSRDTATRRRTVERARSLKHCILTSRTARITRITHFILGTAPTHLPRRRRVDTSQIHGQTFDGCARARRTTRAGSLSSASSKTTSSFDRRSMSSNHGNTRRARSRGTCNLSLSQCHLSNTVDTARYSSGTPAAASHSSVGTEIFSNVLVAIPRPIPPAAARARARPRPTSIWGFLIHPTKNFRHFPIPLKQWDESDFFENRTPRRDARDERAQTARVRRETSLVTLLRVW